MSFQENLWDDLTDAVKAQGYRPTKSSEPGVYVWHVDNDDARYVRASFRPKTRSVVLSCSNPGRWRLYRVFMFGEWKQAAVWISENVEALASQGRKSK
jgi:hypothetical protein